MNDKVYANYLMHGRTKGSRNGISTTKGYTAVGQKAKGHLVNGKYVYDAGVNLPTNYNGLDNYMKVSNSNKTQPYLHSLYPKGYANASDAMKNDPRYSSDSVYVVKYKGSDLNPKPVTKNDPDAKVLRDYIGRLYVTNKQSVATNVAKAGKDKIALNKYDDKPQYLGHKELSDINNNLMLKKIKDEVASKLKAEKEEAVKAKTVVGSKNDWQQQAALEQWKKQNQNAIAASKKAQALKDVAAKGAQNDWQNQGARHRAAMETVRNNGAGFYEITSDVNAYYDRKSQKAREEKAAKLPNAGASQAGNTARAMKEYMTKASAERKAKVQAAKQPTNIGASQSADLARWSQQNRNNIAASKKAAKQQELIKKADASYAANQGKANNWQNQANAQRAMKEYMNKASDERKAAKAKQSASYNKMSSTQKNAMQNDPRYSTGLGANNLAMLYSGPRGKYDYSGKNDSRAPTLITFNGSEKMDRDPYFETWAKSTNKQEVAAAQAKNKEFMNDFRKSKERNSRSDIGNAIADAKEDAKNAFKSLKNKFKQNQNNIAASKKAQALKDAAAKGAANNWQEMGNQRRGAIEAFVKAATGKSNTADIRGMDRKAREEATVRYINDAVSTNAKYRKQQSDLYGAGDAKTRNARSDVRNAYEDANLEAKNAFLAAKEKAGAKLYTKISYLNNKFKKKKKR